MLSAFSVFAGLSLLTINSSKNVEETSAIFESTGGSFELVSSQDELSDGDKVILVGGSDSSLFSVRAFDETVVYVNDITHYCDGEKVVLNRADIEVFELDHLGTDTWGDPIFSFKGINTFGGAYLTLDDENDVVIASSSATSYSRWAVGNAAIGNNYKVLTNNNHNMLTGTYNSTNALVASSGAITNIRIYRWANKVFETLYLHTEPAKMNYYVGDTFNMSGLKVVLEYYIEGSPGEHFTDTITYNGKFFDAYPSTFTSTSTTSVSIKYGNASTDVTGISVSQVDAYAYTRGSIVDFRGSYLITSHYRSNDNLIIFNPKTGGEINGISESSKNSGYIDYQSSFDTDYRVMIERNTISGTSYYHVRNMNNKYLYFTEDGVFFQDNPSISNAATLTCELSDYWGYYVTSIVINDYRLWFKDTSGDYTFVTIAASSGAVNNISFYHRRTSGSVDDEISAYNGVFFDKIQRYCDSTGVENNTSAEDWADVKTSFLTMSLDAQGQLAGTTYTKGVNYGEGYHPNKEWTLSTYDFIVSKYNYEDFMNRKDCGTFIQYLHPIDNMSVSLFGDDSNVNVILIISIISITSLVSFLILRKKHS